MKTREQVEAAPAHQHVLQRQHDEEGQDQAAVVAAPGVRQRDELAQRQEREHAEQQRRADRPRDPGQPEHRRRRPTPRAGRAAAALCASLLLGAARAACARATATLTSTSTPNRMTNSSATCWSTVEERSVFTCRPAAARRTAARARSRNSRLSSPGCKLQRRAEGHRAQDGHRHDLALGHHALHVVDPRRDQLHVGELLGQVVQAALEGLRLAFVAARAFGKDHQRVAVCSASTSGSSGSWSSVRWRLT